MPVFRLSKAERAGEPLTVEQLDARYDGLFWATFKAFAGQLSPAEVIVGPPALAAFVSKQGLTRPDALIVPHPSSGEIRGRHVIGTLPASLACEAWVVTDLRPSGRTDLAENALYDAGDAFPYRVRRLEC